MTRLAAPTSHRTAARIPSEGHVILQNAGGFAFTLILLLGLAIIVAVLVLPRVIRMMSTRRGVVPA